jgi:hypothetical protein
METVAVLGLPALAWRFTTLVKQVTAQDYKAALTQVVTMVAAIAAVLLYAHSSFGTSLDIGGVALATLDGAAQVIVGLSIAGVAGVAFDVKKSIDKSDTAVEPKLGGGA